MSSGKKRDGAQGNAQRLTTVLRIERGDPIPQAGETVMMEREVSHRVTAVTVHTIIKQVEHKSEPGVWLLTAQVTMRDVATDTRGVWLTHSPTERAHVPQTAHTAERKAQS